MKRFKKSSMILLGIILLFAILFIGGCRKAGSWLVKVDPIDQVDAIIMLTGSIPDRVLQVTDLYEKQISDRIIMAQDGTEPYRILEERGATNLRLSARSRNILEELGIPGDCIMILPGDAVSTRDESIIIRDFLANRPEIKSVLLVSSSSHMRRAFMIFSTAFKPLEHSVKVLCSPSSYTEFNPRKWWRRKEDIQHVVMEYAKMGSFILFEKRNLRK